MKKILSALFTHVHRWSLRASLCSSTHAAARWRGKLSRSSKYTTLSWLVSMCGDFNFTHCPSPKILKKYKECDPRHAWLRLAALAIYFNLPCQDGTTWGNCTSGTGAAFGRPQHTSVRLLLFECLPQPLVVVVRVRTPLLVRWKTFYINVLKKKQKKEKARVGNCMGSGRGKGIGKERHVS